MGVSVLSYEFAVAGITGRSARSTGRMARRKLGLRFYRRVRIAPGITLDLSKRGASLSAGVREAHVTIGSRGTRETVGLPGTGHSYSQEQRWRRRRPRARHYVAGFVLLLVVLYLIGAK